MVRFHIGRREGGALCGAGQGRFLATTDRTEHADCEHCRRIRWAAQVEANAELGELRGLLAAEHWENDAGVMQIAGKIAALHARLVARLEAGERPSDWKGQP
jgi:hypothetical protein